MARQIKLTRDERIVLDSIINQTTFTMSNRAFQHTLDKLRNRRLITGDLSDGLDATDDGRRAMRENRQTKPKEAV
jgi:hypothetical protein